MNVPDTSTLETLRAGKRKLSDATILRHVQILEKLAQDNGGAVPPYRWLRDNGYFQSYQAMLDYPVAFAHLHKGHSKTFEIHQAHNNSVLLPPDRFRKLSEYHVQGARFNPTELALESGLSEKEWMNIGRALAAVCQSAFWWIGDFIQYGFDSYGKKVSYDLAQQATGYPRTALYNCAYLAKRFPPDRRVAALTFFHHQCVKGFPNEIADELLAEAVELGLTARQILALGRERCGKKKPQYNRKKVRVYLWAETYEKLLDRAEGMQVGHFISQIVEEYLAGKPVERHANGRKTREWREAIENA
jgi:hypothetical protein